VWLRGKQLSNEPPEAPTPPMPFATPVRAAATASTFRLGITGDANCQRGITNMHLGLMRECLLESALQPRARREVLQFE
jgi:hypothetical protein